MISKKKRNPNGNANRVHVAAELMEHGYVASIGEAFATLLSDDGGFYIPSSRLKFTTVIKELRSLGVLPILAHPLQDLTETELRNLLPAAVEAGLIGMETMHSSYTAEMTEGAEAIAAEYKLMPSGGSDFHGSSKPNVCLGSGKGELCISAKVYFDLWNVWKNQNL